MAAGAGNWFRESEMLYKYVIDTVVTQCKEHFLDEGCPEDVLLDLKAVWEQHVENSKVTHHHSVMKPRVDSRSKASGSAQIVAPQLDGDSSNGDEKGDAGMGSSGSPGVVLCSVGISEEITEEDEEPGVEDPEEMFDTSNIAVCQYKNIVRKKNKFRLHLKSGVMTLNEKDFVFAECIGDVEW